MTLAASYIFGDWRTVSVARDEEKLLMLFFIFKSP